PSVATTWLFAALNVPELVETNRTFAGSGESVSTTFVAGAGPLFLTVIVYVRLWPATTGSGRSVKPLTTTSATAGGASLSTTTPGAKSSDVLPSVSVAVAVMTWPSGSAVGVVNVKVALPLSSVVTLSRRPRKICPSLRPAASATGLAKSSTV